MPGPMRTVSFKLPERLDEALNDLVRRRGSNRSALVREALEVLTKGKRRSVTAAPTIRPVAETTIIKNPSLVRIWGGAGKKRNASTIPKLRTSNPMTARSIP